MILCHRVVTNPNNRLSIELVTNDCEYSACRKKYVRITTDSATQLSEFYARTDENLQVLAELSADIREEVIVPSFSMFEDRSKELQDQLERVASIEFA